MNEIRVTKSQARRFLVRYHGFFGRRKSGKAGVMDVFRRLHSLQYDPLDVVTRNADLVLQARVPDYRPAMLQALLYTDHALIDGWDKMMCIYPAEDFRRFDRLRLAMQQEVKGVLAWRDTTIVLDYLDEVRAHVLAHGASSGKDIPCGAVAKGRWGPARISSAALDYLFHTGELLVANKKGTIKTFDLTERVLPAAAKSIVDFADEAAFLRWYVLRRIGSVGLLWNKSGGGWLGQFLEKKEIRGPVLGELVAEGRLTSVQVEGIQEAFYCKPEDIHLFDGGPVENRVRFLAPLDNMLWDRGMIEALFGFSYTWEVYVPANKRVYGYYVLPILCGERFMGRFEPAQYRKGGGFAYKNLWIEEGFAMTDKKQAALDTALQEFSDYLERS